MPEQDSTGLPPAIMNAIRLNSANNDGTLLIPTPVFTTMKGEFLNFDPETASLTARFPVLPAYLNPYGYLQGGIIAALIDNTIGPLSVLIAPPNVTRLLEIKYSSPITPETGYVTVFAQLLDRKEPKLFFKAVVRDPQGKKVTSAKATHWILLRQENDI